jgi:hypothetical protein
MATTVADETKLPDWARRIIRSLRHHIARLERRQAWLHADEEPRYVVAKPIESIDTGEAK